MKELTVHNTGMTNSIAYSLSSYYYFSKPWDPYFFHLQIWRQPWFVYWPSVPFPWCLPTAAVTCVWPLTRHVNRNVVTLSPTPISMTSVPPHVPHSVPSVTPNAMAAVANKRSEFQTICFLFKTSNQSNSIIILDMFNFFVLAWTVKINLLCNNLYAVQLLDLKLVRSIWLMCNHYKSSFLLSFAHIFL